MAVSRNDVVHAYRLLFNRVPESEAAIAHHALADDLWTLLATLLRSPEFLSLRAGPGGGHLPQDLPPLEIDTDASDEDAGRCLAEIKRAWTQLGIDRPHFSVLTEARFMPENIANSLEQFWQSGEVEANRVGAMARHYADGTPADRTCVEFGCGVGRVTVNLARHYASVHAYDISATHLALARSHASKAGLNNIVFHQCSDDPLAGLAPCDFYYSSIVLQHNPPVIISRLIRNAMRSLNPGGIAIFQVPTYRIGYRFKTAEWLAASHALDMQMHCLPQARIFEIIAEERCAALEVRENDWVGPIVQWRSNLFVVRKSPSPTPPPLPPPARR